MTDDIPHFLQVLSYRYLTYPSVHYMVVAPDDPSGRLNVFAECETYAVSLIPESGEYPS